jgi:hypothetical protein
MVFLETALEEKGNGPGRRTLTAAWGHRPGLEAENESPGLLFLTMEGVLEAWEMEFYSSCPHWAAGHSSC